MKALFIAGLMVISSNVFASKIVPLKNLTNKRLDMAASALVATDIVTHSTYKKVIELKGKGTSAQEIRMNTVAQAAHTACPFFDDGVALSLNKKDATGTASAVADLIDSSNPSKEEELLIAKNIAVFIGEQDIEVYSGNASGNNTAGTVVGIYDTKNNEVAVFANTNCGSDD